MRDRFFTKLDWSAFWTATVVTFIVYFYTLGPSVGLEDSGELATAGAHLGVPHPPGYPFWTLCSWIFCKVFSFVTYMGHPTPAWCISLFSATAGAFAAGCTAMLICRSARDFVSQGNGGSGGTESLPKDAMTPILAFGGGVAGALTFALSPVEWSQSTIVEIYSLNALFLMWVFLLSYRWMRKPSDKILWITAFVFGLGLTNYQVLVFAIVPLALIMMMKNVGMFRDVFIYLAPVALTYQVLQVGSLFRASREMQSDCINKHLPVLEASAPSTTVLVIALAAVVAALLLAAYFRRRGEIEKGVKALLYGGLGGAGLTLLCAFLFTSKTSWTGVAEVTAPLIAPAHYTVIAALGLASVALAAVAALKTDAGGKIWKGSGMRYLVGAAVCAGLAVMVASGVSAAGDLGYTGVKYPWGKSTAVCLVIVAALFALCAFTPKGLAFAVPVAGVQLAAFVLLGKGAMNGLTHPCSWWFCWPIAWNFILLALAIVTLPNGRSVAGAAFFAQLGVSFYAYMPVVSDLRNPPMNWGYPRTWEGFKHAIQRGQYEAIGFPSFPTLGAFFAFFFRQMGHYFQDVMVQFTDLLVFFALVPFACGHFLVEKARRKEFWQWMGAAAACFLMMSFLLILLANVKGDIQDGFIQKVKFISSHAMIALWIGYGLVFAAVLVLRRLRRPALAGAVAAAMVAVALAYPIVQNYTDDQMVFELGGNEQNGHTFGWQFGAYQLDGAKAIVEQLVADEEPLPDPEWPEPMEEYSIFFGGTDPGRFVPTYMIYSADYRPDVYLITQNALADDTYMSVERDLYGDEIWIPSKEDSGEAFNIYVDEVKRGVRQANGDLKIENGRVQVTGALGVMEINGILTEMMFRHDRLRHAFYVEESYAIQWMYPYLSPHGLIMKINPDKKPYDAKIAARDAEFWDWYVRRLLKDPMYRRDFAAQKSFSKLRAAIAGLYAKQNRRSEAAQAFREAVLLYPASPEATFRYAQEILMPYQRWDVILELMDYTDRIDPNNRRTQSLREYVSALKASLKCISELEPKLRNRTLTVEETKTLASAFAQIGRTSTAAQLLKQILPVLKSAAEFADAGRLFLSCGMDAEAMQAIGEYLKLEPQADANLWVEYAKLQHRANRVRDAQQSFINAYKIDSQGVYMRLVSGKDKELMQIAEPLFRKK